MAVQVPDQEPRTIRHMNDQAWILLQQLWRCHQHDPINIFEYTRDEHTGARISHPATRQAFTVDPELVWHVLGELR